jgi:hypothetical protein
LSPIGPDPDILERGTPRFTALLIALAIFTGSLGVRGRYVSDAARVDAGGGYTLHAFCGQGSVALALTSGGEYFKDKDKEKKDAVKVEGGKKTIELGPPKPQEEKAAGPSWWFYSAARPPIAFHARWSNLGSETQYNRGGFVAIREPSRGTVAGGLAPCLPVAAGLAAVAAVRVVWFRLYTRRRGRIIAGLCPDCGHDMRALVERCPNCGRPRSRGGMRINRPRNADEKRRAA